LTDPSSSDDGDFGEFLFPPDEDKEKAKLVLQLGQEEDLNMMAHTRYKFISRDKLAFLFTIFSIKCPQADCFLFCELPIIHNFGMCYTMSFRCLNDHQFPWINGELEAKRHLLEISPRCIVWYFPQGFLAFN
jgi:hypothetical protein